MNNKLISKLFSNVREFSQLFCDYKVQLRDEDFTLLFMLISQKRKYKDMFGSRFFPQRPVDLIYLKNAPLLYNNEKYMDNIAFCSKYEIRYLINLVLFYKCKINYFCTMRDKFEKAVMYSRYGDAENILEEIFNRIGYSFWYIEARLILFEVTRGNASKNSFFCDLEMPDALSIIRTYILILKDKVSLDINERLFDERFDEYCNAPEDDNLTNCLTDYIRFSCYGQQNMNENLLRNLLTSTSYLPLVDSYILLEKIISSIVSSGVCSKNESLLCDDILRLIRKMAVDISWIGWKNILVLIGQDEFTEINQEKLEVHHALKLFCKQKEDKCAEYCLIRLQKYSNNLSFMNLLAKCDASIPDGLCGRIVDILKKLYIKDSEDYSFNSLIVDCDIYIRFFSFFSFGSGFSVLASQEIESQIPYIKERYVVSLIHYAFTPSKMVFFLPKQDRLKFIENYRVKLNELYFCDWQMATYEELRTDYAEEFIMDDVSKKIIDLFGGHSDKIIKAYEDCNIKDNNLKNRIYSSMLVKVLFDVYVSKKKYQNAINVYLDAYFLSKVMVRKIDYKCLNRKLTYTVREALESNIEYCVYIDITEFGKNDDEVVSEYVMNSFKMVLMRKKLDRPSSIAWPEGLRDKQLLSYFWFNICIREVIGRLLPPFYIHQDIDDERLAIIEKLLLHYKEVGDERNLSYLRREKDIIEKERDLEKISNCLNRGKINIDQINYRYETNDALVLAVDRGVNSTAILENGDIDDGIFQEFVNTFNIIKKNYALEVDRMISVNIRHGILENKLIRYFKKNGLCTKQTDPPSEKKILKTFYSDVYRCVEQLNQEYIGVSYKDEAKRISLVFDESFLRKNIYRLKDVCLPDDLKQVCLDILNIKLKDELRKLGQIVYDVLYTGLNELLDCKILNSQSIYSNQAIQCKDALDYELCKMKDWFSFAEHFAGEYKFNAWIEQLMEDYPYICINSDAPDGYMLSASRLKDMDILFHNLILNIFKHSGYEEHDTLLNVVACIKYQYIECSHVISLWLSNTVSPLKKQDDIISDIKMIYSLMKQGESEKSCLEDRRSGYKKIIRLLERNYKDRWELNPDYDVIKKEFIVNLKIRYEEEHEESINC